MNRSDASAGLAVHDRRRRGGALLALAFVLALLGVNAPVAHGQAVPVRDLVIDAGSVPVRLVGYGLVTGLPGTGDLTISGRSSAHTVTSIANLLRRFDIAVPAHLLRTRNVAAVLVTTEVSPYLRPGGRFDVHIASIGDARSLHGGVLWMTPLVAEAGGVAFATAQGPLQFGDAWSSPRSRLARADVSAQIPSGGLLQVELPRPAPSVPSRLLLRHPDFDTATRIAAVIDSAIGEGTATVEDPGAIALQLPDTAAAALAVIHGLRVEPTRTARLVLDTRSNTLVLGGELQLGPGVVSVGGITVTISAVPADTSQVPVSGALRFRTGATAQDLADALQTIGAPPQLIAQIFQALHQSGAVAAEVVTR